MLNREQFYGEVAAAQMLGVSPRTMQRMRSEGWGPPYTRVGKRLIGYSESALRDYAKTRTFASHAAELSGHGAVTKAA